MLRFDRRTALLARASKHPRITPRDFHAAARLLCDMAYGVGRTTTGAETAGDFSEAPLSAREILQVAIAAGQKHWHDKNGNIDVDAQRSLARMSRDPSIAPEANAMLDALRNFTLRGIFTDVELAPSLRADKFQHARAYKLIPRGKDSILLLDPTDLISGPPMIVFRESIRSKGPLVDAALREAWAVFQTMQQAPTGEILACDASSVPGSSVAAIAGFDGFCLGIPLLTFPVLTNVHRYSVTMRSGRQVGDVQTPGSNVREDVLLALGRLHMLWSITDGEYAAEFPAVASRAPGSTLTPADIPMTIAGLARNEQPTIAVPVAARFLNAVLSAPVGSGLPNVKGDVLTLQNGLNSLGYLSSTDYAADQATISASQGPTVSLAGVPATTAALVQAKTAIVAGRYGFQPLHAVESFQGGDRYADQTFTCGMFTIFIPRGATDANNVHVHFSPGSVAGNSGLNSVLHHGLRSAADASPWILVAVPGREPGFNTISMSDITSCLSRAGRTGPIDALRLSAHSRGYRGLRESIRQGLLSVSLIDRVVVLDANYTSLANVLRRAGVSGSRVTAYSVTTGPLPLPGSRTIVLGGIAGCLRAIGYVRLIQDAMVTRPSLVIPPGIRSQLIALPRQGNFTTTASPAPPEVNLVAFCRANRVAIRRILSGEGAANGLMRFMEDNDLTRFGQRFPPGIYSHHFFVTEIAHEITD